MTTETKHAPYEAILRQHLFSVYGKNGIGGIKEAADALRRVVDQSSAPDQSERVRELEEVLSVLAQRRLWWGACIPQTDASVVVIIELKKCEDAIRAMQTGAAAHTRSNAAASTPDIQQHRRG